MCSTQLKYFLSEAIGVFTLVFFGAGAAIISSDTNTLSHFGVSLVFGLSVTCIISGVSRFSGAHLNPVVTFALCAVGKCSFKCFCTYTTAQLIGSCLASAVLFSMFGQKIEVGSTILGPGVSVFNGFIVELILTLFLVLTVLGTTNAVVIGSVVFLGAFVGGGLTGAGMNPARSFGPALFSHHWDNHWIYWFAPLAGTIISLLLYKILSAPDSASTELAEN